MQKKLYQMETFWTKSYLDNLIGKGIAVSFNLVDVALSENIKDWEKEIWGISEVKDFMKRHNL